MAWCLPGDKLLSEPMTISLLTHICVTRPQKVKTKKIDHAVSMVTEQDQFVIFRFIYYWCSPDP